MVAARFEAPEARLESRKRLLVRVEDVDGPISEFPKSSSLLVLALAAANAFAIDVPAGTEIQLRLKTKISTRAPNPRICGGGGHRARYGRWPFVFRRRPGPHMAPSRRFAIGEGRRTASSLALNFTELEIDGTKVKLAAQVPAWRMRANRWIEQGQSTASSPPKPSPASWMPESTSWRKNIAGFAGVLGRGEGVGVQGRRERYHLRHRRRDGDQALPRL